MSDSSSSSLFIEKISPDAVTPSRGSAGAAGYDLHSYLDYTIEPGCRKLISTQIKVQLPSGTYGRIAPRSGLSVKHGINVGAGVVDKDFSGEVFVLLFNNSDTAYNIKKNDRVAQLILEKHVIADVFVVDKIKPFAGSNRGANGFGSTGV